MTRDQIESLHRGLVTKVDKQLADLQKQKELQKKREEEEKLRKIREQMELERKKREEEERRRKQLEEEAKMYVCNDLVFRSSSKYRSLQSFLGRRQQNMFLAAENVQA